MMIYFLPLRPSTTTLAASWLNKIGITALRLSWQMVQSQNLIISNIEILKYLLFALKVFMTISFYSYLDIDFIQFGSRVLQILAVVPVENRAFVIPCHHVKKLPPNTLLVQCLANLNTLQILMGFFNINQLRRFCKIPQNPNINSTCFTTFGLLSL